MKLFQLFAFILITSTSISQTKMKPVEDLIDLNDSGWKSVKEWSKSAQNKVEILPADPQKLKTLCIIRK